MKVKEESEKVSLKLSIHKAKIMAPSPISSWQIDGEIGNSDRLYFGGGFKITAGGDTVMKLRYLLFGRKVMTNLDSILKSRDINLPTTVSLVKAMVFPVVMYGCESWTVKKAENCFSSQKLLNKRFWIFVLKNEKNQLNILFLRMFDLANN